jgi:signal transduction histidine kinase
MRTNRLFVKIFLWFWLAMTLIGAIGVVIALTTDPKAAFLSRNRNRLTEIGMTLVGIYENAGQQELAEYSHRVSRETNIRTLLFRGTEGLLSGRRIPPRLRHIAEMALSEGEPQHHQGRRGLWVAIPLEKDYVLVAELPPPSPVARMLDPRLIGLRLMAIFVVGSLVCYLLARSLTAPIFRLREMTQKFAGGKLETRVGHLLGSRKDEIADLGRDFDMMAERIERLVKGQKRLLRDISHELRSPLARLNIAVELARQRSGTEAADALERIERESARLNTLIGQLMELTSVGNGSQNVSRGRVNLSEIVDDIVGDAAFEAQDRRCSVTVAANEVVTLEGSEEMLRSAIENVVRNGLHYTEDGTAVEVSLIRKRKDGRSFAEISVRDHGPGVPEDALDQLFQPFYRVAEARERSTGGAGIGLAITERAVRLHGGTVKAFNHPEKGLVVLISLPAE